ncbi:MAG: hypothetical protein PVI07_17720 [Anaerolineae bacterium]|jgi:hypothetical protein
MTDERKGKEDVDLSVEDIEAALLLLSAEERTLRPERRRVISHFVWVLSMGIVLVACPMGLLAVWFDRILGVALLVAAAIMVVLFFISGTGASLSDTSEQIRETIEQSALGEAAKAGWEQRSLVGIIGWSFALGTLVFLAGIGLLIYGLVTARHVSPLSLAMIALPVLVVFLFLALDEYREFVYFTRVSRLRSQFASHLQKGSAEGADQVPVSSAQYDMLSRIETQQVQRRVAQSARDWPQLKQAYHAVSFSPSLHKYLQGLPDEAREQRWVLRTVADTLQTNPRPPGTRPAFGYPNRFVTRRQGYDVTFSLDRDRQRVNLISISPTGGREVNDVS